MERFATVLGRRRDDELRKYSTEYLLGSVSENRFRATAPQQDTPVQ
jgi:hypothetical protein